MAGDAGIIIGQVIAFLLLFGPIAWMWWYMRPGAAKRRRLKEFRAKLGDVQYVDDLFSDDYNGDHE